MKYYTFVLLEWGWGEEGGIRTLSHTGAVISIIYFQAHKWCFLDIGRAVCLWNSRIPGMRIFKLCSAFSTNS